MQEYNKKSIDRIVREYYKGELTPRLDQRIRRWLEDKENRKEKDQAVRDLFFEEVVRQKKPDLNTVRSLEQMRSRLGWDVGDKFRRRRKLFKIAALLITGSIAAGTLVRYFNPVETEDTVNRTIVENIRVEERLRTVVLPDGSRVTLAAGSTLCSGTDRSYTLVGEGYFSVTPSPEPFVVTTARMKVTVLGTEFNLSARADDDHSSVELYTGSVKLEGLDLDRTLAPGQALRLDHDTMAWEINQTDPDTGDTVPGWLQDALTFDGAPLEEIFACIEAYYNVRVENRELIDTGQRYSLRIEGTEDPALIMSLLAAASGNEFGYRIYEDRVIIETSNQPITAP